MSHPPIPLRPAFVNRPEPLEPRDRNPRLRAPIQQITTSFPVGIEAEFQWRFADSKTSAWRKAEPGRVLWPLDARGMDIRPIE